MAIHIETPALASRAFSLRSGKDVRLKMEALQPSGSFKARGIGHACQIYKSRGARRFISSSGGNAGYAVAYAGRMLATPVTVVVPATTSERAKSLIRSEGAEVIVHGASWMEANARALELMTEADAFLHPFDDPLLWEGHATMIDELARQGGRPDAVICSVGGGGLLCGVVEGLRRNGWAEVPVIAAETAGADSYAQALHAGAPVLLPEIRSIATSLGARQVCDRALDLAKEHSIESVVVSDAAAVAACEDVLLEHRILVEPACGASVAALDGGSEFLKNARSVAVILCGGVGVTAGQLAQWSTQFVAQPR
ncbi:pyridoxal-phosphate dependent enzyme [Achromobacter xylosoxidans]|uniref:pyridoxal-phosphate dependent enzyme n=1 Tax=Alcaligenes xylosoxydans xylosoxydans TaxID=85698 RepID=UPI000B48D9C7|nr:pyridoxal-phosphate dependent enzyme [Achromobacter xylosoxidans]